MKRFLGIFFALLMAFSANGVNEVLAQDGTEAKPADTTAERTPSEEEVAESIIGGAEEVADGVEAAAKNKPPVFYEGGFAPKGGQSRYSLQGLTATLLPGVASWIAGFLGALAVLFLIWAGIQFLTAGGDEDKINKATKTALYVAGGLLLTMFAYSIVYLFLTLFTPGG